jgi:hypothetical protein
MDFMNVLNNVSGMDFTDFFDQWYFGEGYPTYSIVWSQNEGGLNMEVSQTTSMPSVTPLFTNLVAYKFHFYSGGDTTVYLKQTDNVTNFTIPITEEVGLIQVDPDNWIVNQTGSIVTNVEEHDGPLSFEYSPNPANDKLNISFGKSSTLEREIGIYNLAGKELLSERSMENNISFDISNFPTATYIIKVSDEMNQISQKFIKLD